MTVYAIIAGTKGFDAELDSVEYTAEDAKAALSYLKGRGNKVTIKEFDSELRAYDWLEVNNIHH